MDDEVLQQIANENNLAETAFYVRNQDFYEIRWFTPTVEVDLCGHATLAAAFVLFNCENNVGNEINFQSPRSGPLTVTRSESFLSLNFPTDNYNEIEATNQLSDCFDIRASSTYKGKTDYLFVFEGENQVRNIKPNLPAIAALSARGIIVTAQGSDVDFVSRFFAPGVGVNEDPVTGSAHTTLTPYWAKRLGKIDLTARQLSARTGYLLCKYLSERVEISGRAKLYLKGEIYID